MASSWVPDEDNNLAYYFKESNPDRKVIFDLKYFDQIKSEVKIRIETGFAYKSISRWPLRTFVWKYILHKDIPDGHQVIVINGNVLDVRESNLRLFKKSPDYTNRPLSIHRQYDDNLAALHDPTATVLTHGDNKIIMERIEDPMFLLPSIRCVKGSWMLLHSGLLLKQFVWQNYNEAIQPPEDGVLMPLNYSQNDVRPMNLVKVFGIAKANSAHPPKTIDLPDDWRQHVPSSWHFFPFGLKFSNMKTQYKLSISTMIASGNPPEWKRDHIEGFDFKKISKVLGECYRKNVQLWDHARFSDTDDPSTVFDLVNSRYNIVMAQMKAILPKPTYEFIIKSGGINSRI